MSIVAKQEVLSERAEAQLLHEFPDRLQGARQPRADGDSSELL